MANIIEITSFEAPELDVYARLTEGQLRSRQNPESVSTEDITGVFRTNFVICTHAEGD